MKRFLLATALSVVVSTSALAAPKNLTITSSSFKSGKAIPLAFACSDEGGGNTFPNLKWSKVPTGTKSIAVFLKDPDAPDPKPFYHVGIYGITSKTTSLVSGYKIRGSIKAGMNDFGDTSYDGPCPPTGKTHHYDFVVYALKSAIKPKGSDNYDGDLEKSAAKVALAKGTLVGLFTGVDTDSSDPGSSTGNPEEDQCLNGGGSWLCTTVGTDQSCQCTH